MNRSKTVEAIRTRLRTLGCPFADEGRLYSKQNMVNIVAWLEDQIIRLYDVGDRKELRTNDKHWNNAFTKYLTDLSCPCIKEGINDNNKLQCLLWVSSHAISVEYEDNYEQYNAKPEEVTLSEDDEALLNLLCQGFLRIAAFLNISIVDKSDFPSIIKIVETELIEMAGRKNQGVAKELPWHLEDLPITINTSNELLRKAICVLECLYNEDIREIQDQINYIIEQVQIVTAHPNTDSSLGKVGVWICLYQ